MMILLKTEFQTMIPLTCGSTSHENGVFTAWRRVVHSDEEFGWTDGKNGRHAREFGSNRSLLILMPPDNGLVKISE